MIAAWLSSFFRYADLSLSTLRGTLAIYTFLDVLPTEREAIAHEIAMRSWAAWLEARLGTTIAWCRGGRS
jgi:hypothetical protein